VTPALLPNLAPSGHRLTLELPGFRPWTQAIQVGEGTLETVRARLVARPYTINAAVSAEHGGELELSFEASGPSGAPADGVLELGAPPAAGSWREPRAALVEGKARAVLVPAAQAAAISISVGLGSQREVFELHRAPDGWTVTPP
jgi:hypothetical protein